MFIPRFEFRIIQSTNNHQFKKIGLQMFFLSGAKIPAPYKMTREKEHLVLGTLVFRK